MCELCLCVCAVLLSLFLCSFLFFEVASAPHDVDFVGNGSSLRRVCKDEHTMQKFWVGGGTYTIFEVLLLVTIVTQLPLYLLAMVVQGCPARLLIRPCECNEITKGLELLCEGKCRLFGDG